MEKNKLKILSVSRVQIKGNVSLRNLMKVSLSSLIEITGKYLCIFLCNQNRAVSWELRVV
jgi:hypothetical protein